jgi:signal transduction histidine kinase
VVLSLLVPFVVAGAIVSYNLLRLEMVAQRISHLELADDVNLTLLELRRYEKNILLFRQEKDVQAFLANLRRMRESLRGIEDDVLSEMSSNAYRSLVEAVEEYERASRSLIADVAAEQKLEGDIRPLGRTLEKDAAHREIAFEIRRYEKNYLIYDEGQAVQRLRVRAAELVEMQPSLGAVMARYLDAFGAIVRNRAEKERTLDRMRHRGRDIQKITMELSGRERSEIDRTIAMSKRLSAAALVFLIVSLNVIGYLFSRYVRTTLGRIEDALNGLESGNYTHIDIARSHLPAEIASLVATYNRTIDALGASKAELERSMGLLEDVNREIIDRQDEIIEVRKLSAMRLLASEIAHEVNNPLSSLSLFLGVMREEMPSSDARRETLSLMMKEATRCQEVVRELASFAKKETLTYRAINPAKLVSDAIEVVKKQHRSKNIDLVASLVGLPQSAVVDPILIHQALVNVLANAFQFTPEGGSVEVSGRAARNCMTFTISDGGAGISSEHLPYIFEPFFSTRKDRGGSGLGLAITQKIIERHHGCIRAESTPGEKTVFTIELPIEQERASCCRERS